METQNQGNLELMANDINLKKKCTSLVEILGNYKYTYNFKWLGVPIIQCPQDIVAIQELIWNVKPDVIVETGIAKGGSLVLSASILHLLNNNGRVIGVDIDIRDENRIIIQNHPLSSRINLIQGSSIDRAVFEKVKALIQPNNKVMVILDSNHTHEHVIEELRLFSSIVDKGSYLIVMDTNIDDMPNDYFVDRPWGRGNNPKTAVHEFLKTTDRFEIDSDIHNKLLITVAPDGYLKCIK